MPRHYLIRVSPRLGPHWSVRFPGLVLTDAPPDATELAGPLPDQAALHGVLAQLRDLGLTLLSIDSLPVSP